MDALTHRGRSPRRSTCRCTRSPTTLVPPPCSPTVHHRVGDSSRHRCCAAPEPWPMTSPAATRNRRPGRELPAANGQLHHAAPRTGRSLMTSPWLAPDQTTTSVNGHEGAERRNASTSPVAPLAPVLDFGTVRELRHQVADQLAARLQAQPVRDPAAQRELGRALAAQTVADLADERNPHRGDHGLRLRRAARWRRRCWPPCSGSAGCSRWWMTSRSRTSRSTAATEVWLSYADGREEPGPPVADSDDELVELLQLLAARLGQGERSFTTADPAAAPAPGGRLAAGGHRVGDAPPAGGDPPAPGPRRRPERPGADRHHRHRAGRVPALPRCAPGRTSWSPGCRTPARPP